MAVADHRNASFAKLVLAAFGMCALVSMTNVACSTATDVDSGTSELHGGSHYGVYGVGYAYGFGTNLAADSVP